MDYEEPRKLLQNSRLFKGFSPEIIEAILPVLAACSFAADNLICLKGDVSDCLYIIRKGVVEISVSSSEGKVIVLGTLSEGDVFGEIGLLDKKSRTANVTAQSDVSLYRLSNTDFDRLSASFGIDEARSLTSYVCFLFRRVTNNLEETVFLDASIRIGRKILELCENGKNQEIAISQENLGRMAGLSREATNKALARLEEAGLIEQKYKHISIPDPEKFTRALRKED